MFDYTDDLETGANKKKKNETHQSNIRVMNIESKENSFTRPSVVINQHPEN